MKFVLVAPLWLTHYSWGQSQHTILRKLHQEIVPRNRWAHVVGRLGGFMLERHSCRKARGNQCNSKVSRLSLSCSIPGVSCQGKRASSHICLALTCPCFQSDPLFIELEVFHHRAQRDIIYLTLVLSYLRVGYEFVYRAVYCVQYTVGAASLVSLSWPQTSVPPASASHLNCS